MEWKDQLIADYLNSDNRLLLLDYDGTLVPFAETPEKAYPDKNLFLLLKELAGNKKNEVIIISGRKHETLEKWLGNIDIGLIAEHGAWLKEGRDHWETFGSLKNEWKEKIKTLLRHFSDKVPGSFIEEKSFSLVWHYRNVDFESASPVIKELKGSLITATKDSSLAILEGNKVIEIKNREVNKGRTALKWMSKRERDFILFIGDDTTDEDVFSVLPESAYSIKVGTSPTLARFRLDSVSSVRHLLSALAKP